MTWLNAAGGAIFFCGMYLLLTGLLWLSWATLHFLGKLLYLKENPND